ncbi:hypothetical protein [Neofamilia massiliensis]|nr:hypothetical protein [Neofamilia massiliensis]
MPNYSMMIKDFYLTALKVYGPLTLIFLVLLYFVIYFAVKRAIKKSGLVK